MKKISILGCLVLLATTLNAQIKFETTDLRTGLEKAKREGKMVFIDGSAVWCGPCKLMEKTVFKDKTVGDYFSKNIVAFKIDVEKGDGPAIKRTYDVQGLPGYVFLDSNGNVIFKESGSCSVEAFMSYVKQAEVNAKDPNNVGVMALKYEKNKNDERFVRQYIDKLVATKGVGYFDVFEHYLSMQKSMPEQSKEMIDFLVANKNVLTFCGEADRIIRENIKSDLWKLYVRKDIRQFFQDLHRPMAQNSSSYAIKTVNEEYLRSVVDRVEEERKLTPESEKAIFMDFYLNANLGEEYKKAAFVFVSDFANALDIEKLKAVHLRTLAEMKADPTKQIRSFGKRDTGRLAYMVKDYCKFVKTDEEKADVLSWGKICYDIIPSDIFNVNFYADLLYLYGDKNEALALKTKAVELDANSKRIDVYRSDLELMKKGKSINLTL